MPLYFALCDDEPEQTAYIKSLLMQWASDRPYAIDIRTFDSAEAFLFTYAEDRRFDILLLDIQMKGMDGMSLAKRLRRDNTRVQIIFITGYSDFFGEGYEVDALHYLMKPVDESKLQGTLDKAVARLQTTSRMVSLPDGSGFLRVTVNEVLYAEAFSHHVTLNMTARAQNFKMRITDMEILLGEGFLRCHRSYVVNMRHVRRITRTALELDNGTLIPLSRGSYEEAHRMFIDIQ